MRAWKTVFPFLFPFTAIFAVFLLYPAVYSVILSFEKASIYSDLSRIFSDLQWVGFKNYSRVIEDKEFQWSLVMTLYYAVLVIPMNIALSLSLAALLSNKLPGAKFFRAAFYLPNILDLFVIAVVWTAIYAPNYGVLDMLFKALDITSLFESGILSDPWWAMPGVAIAVVLKGAGFGMILYLAAIQNIPADVYEAADIDGATGWQKFIRITIPLVKPVTLLLVVTGILGSLTAFSEMYAMTGGKPTYEIPAAAPYFGGSVQGMTRLSGYYLFQQFYENQDYGYAAAVSVVLLIISLPLSVISFFAFRTDGPTLGELARKLKGRWLGPKPAAAGTAL